MPRVHRHAVVAAMTCAALVATLSPAWARFHNFRGTAVLETPDTVCRDGVAGLVLSEGTTDDPHATFRFDDITAASPPPTGAEGTNPYPAADTIVATADITLSYVAGGIEVDEDNDGQTDADRRYHVATFDLRWERHGHPIELVPGNVVEIDVDEEQVRGPSQAQLEVADCYLDTTRLSGWDRWATAAAISREAFPEDGSADAVVLARGDDPGGFADALSGAPLAAAVNGPSLLTTPDRLAAPTEQELVRVLPRGRTVHVLGGTAAISTDVTDRLRELGYVVDRIRGHDRIATALAVAERLGDPATLLITSGDTFPDALAAAPAAVATHGAVLLVRAEERSAAVDEYLADHPHAARYAVGGPAARPYPEATPLVGADRIATALAVAERFFPHPTVVGVARADRFPDSLAGGAHIGRLEGPLLLTHTEGLPGAVGRYVCDRTHGIEHAFLYGGANAVSPDVRDALAARIAGSAC